jgi:Ca2+-binding RTX toxin-like protein
MRKAAGILAIVSLAGLGLLQAAPSGAAAPMCMGRAATIVGTPGNDVIRGTSEADVIVGGGGKDIIDGLAKDDYICGGKGADKLYGSFGNDRISGGGGNDTIDGGPDMDVASYESATSAVDININGSKAIAGPDKIPGIETVFGSPFADTMVTQNGIVSVHGGPGNDKLYSKNGGGMIGGAGSNKCYRWQFVYGLNAMGFLPSPC